MYYVSITLHTQNIAGLLGLLDILEVGMLHFMHDHCLFIHNILINILKLINIAPWENYRLDIIYSKRDQHGEMHFNIFLINPFPFWYSIITLEF